MAPSTILITGASRGIGLQLVKKYSGSSPPPTLVLAACRDPDKAFDLKAFKAESSTNIEIIRLDVSDPASINTAFHQVDSLCPQGLNILVNNAGIFPVQFQPEKFNFESMELAFRVNSVGPTILTKTLHPLLKKAASTKGWVEGGDLSTTQAGVVMISSDLGSVGGLQSVGCPTTYDFLGYSASKSALNMVTKCLSLEYAKDGILVACVHPGWVRTDMGGSQGQLSVEQSADFLVNTIEKMEPGKYYNYDFAVTGKYLTW